MIGPLPFLLNLLTGVGSVILLAAGPWIYGRWRDGELADDRWLWLAGGLVAFSLLGRLIVVPLITRRDDDPPRPSREARRRQVAGPQGAVLEVEETGRDAGPTIVLTHGWALNSTIWAYAKRALGVRYRVVVWDLPGMGRSHQNRDGVFGLEFFADCLRTVVDDVDGPVVLVGHSIGGMTTLTFARRHEALLGGKVRGLALVNTTFTDPTRTMWGRSVFHALKRPVLTPLMWIGMALFPLVWLANWLSFLNGSAELAGRVVGFGSRRPTRDRLRMTVGQTVRHSPAVQNKGNLAMFRWDASDVPPRLSVPTLVLGGGKDLLTQADASRRIAAEAPGAELIVFEDVGHIGFLERPDDYDAAVSAFAERAFAGSEPRT